MTQNQQKDRPSWRGVCLRELIAAGVKASGGDIIGVGKEYEKRIHSNWHPPRGWQFEKIDLSKGARAEYLVPDPCKRQDVAILQLHGGGYTLGFLPQFQQRAPKLARLGGQVPVLSLDYRVAPEHHYPAPLEDALRAVEWLRKEKGIGPESVIAVGESSGANLALALAMKLRDEGMGSLRALVLMSPWTDLTCRGESYESRYDMDPMFGRRLPRPDDDGRTAISRVYAGDQDLTDPYLSPRLW